MKGLTDIPGILVGHASDYDGLTGCTVILCERGAVAGGDIRGGATGTEEWDLLSPLNGTDRIHGVSLAGRSVYGLEAASGVRRFLEHKGVGFQFGPVKVPLVVGAILFDFAVGKPAVRPSREMGESAAAAASDKAVEEGAIGAGTGATVGKMLGMKQAMKSGIGSYTVELPGGFKVSALAAVNAVGDVKDPSTGQIVAGARKSPDSMEFADGARAMKMRAVQPPPARENTTLVVVATNALLTKVEANKLAQSGSLGMARAIDPVNTMNDGDLVIALSVGEKRAPIDALGAGAAEAVAGAILRAVKMAPSMAGLPGLKK